MRESVDELGESEVSARVRSVLEEKALVDLGPQPVPLSADRPSTRVSFWRLSTQVKFVAWVDSCSRIVFDISLSSSGTQKSCLPPPGPRGRSGEGGEGGGRRCGEGEEGPPQGTKK